MSVDPLVLMVLGGLAVLALFAYFITREDKNKPRRK